MPYNGYMSLKDEIHEVWRFRELLPFAQPEQIVTIGEGQTLLQSSDPVGKYVSGVMRRYPGRSRL